MAGEKSASPLPWRLPTGGSWGGSNSKFWTHIGTMTRVPERGSHGWTRSSLGTHWDHKPRSAAFRPQTPLPLEGAGHLPKGVELPALLRPEGRAPKFWFMGSFPLVFSHALRR